MLGSRVYWQLLLVWTLLVGQPVFGDSDTAEESSLQEPEEPVPVSEEPENLVPEWEDPKEQVPVWEEQEEKKPPTDEELEEMEREEREWLEQEEEKPCGSWFQYLQQMAVGHYNREKNEYYKQLGDAFLRTKKAIGTMVDLKMILVRTNCTKDQVPTSRYYDSFMYSMYDGPRFPENCEMLKGSEQECSFKLFDDARRVKFRSTPVLSRKCKPIRLNTESH